MIKTKLISNNFKIKSYSEQFPEIKIVSFEKRRDDRGYLLKTFTSQELQQEIESLDEIYYSFSKKNIIRGIHMQTKPYGLIKLVTCVNGLINDFFIDLRISSPTYKQFGSIELNDEQGVIIPYGFGHGFSVLSETATVLYVQNGLYNKENEIGVNPLSLSFDWKVSDPILSERDKSLPNIDSVNFKL